VTTVQIEVNDTPQPWPQFMSPRPPMLSSGMWLARVRLPSGRYVVLSSAGHRGIGMGEWTSGYRTIGSTYSVRRIVDMLFQNNDEKTNRRPPAGDARDAVQEAVKLLYAYSLTLP
jgi:hypothetical protein